jgi:hypothetical protein
MLMHWKGCPTGIEAAGGARHAWTQVHVGRASSREKKESGPKSSFVAQTGVSFLFSLLILFLS